MRAMPARSSDVQGSSDGVVNRTRSFFLSFFPLAVVVAALSTRLGSSCRSYVPRRFIGDSGAVAVPVERSATASLRLVRLERSQDQARSIFGTMTATASPPPSLDPGQAGQIWRRQALEGFEEKVKALGSGEGSDGGDGGNGELAALMEQVRRLTAELDDLYVRQESTEDSGALKRWWHDGEYDAGRADAWNDEGLAACEEGRRTGQLSGPLTSPTPASSLPACFSSYGRAFECFTEAIRLHPQSAVYHCNRSLAGLKLGRYDLALEDARNAIARREGYISAHVRAGKASMGLGDGEGAKKYFEEAVRLDEGCKAAAKGLRDAERLLVTRRAQEAANVAKGNACVRPRLPWTVDELSSGTCGTLEETATRLIAAEGMLRAVGPGQGYKVAGAMYDKAECLILLGRYAQAIEYMKGMDGVGGEHVAEMRYLRAEAAWRRGDLESALVLLEGMEDIEKCFELERAVRGYRDAIDHIRTLLQDGMDSEAITRCDELMAEGGIAASVCGGLVAVILRHRAKGYCQRRCWVEAQADLDACLEVNAEDVEAIRERADVLRERGLYTEYFLSLQGMKRVAPGMPGLAALIEDAARLASTEDGVDQRAAGGQEGMTPTRASGSITSFEVLGVQRGATIVEVRRKYLKLAAQWHPDKWAGKPETDLKAAEAKFKAIKDAYEDLTG